MPKPGPGSGEVLEKRCPRLKTALGVSETTPQHFRFTKASRIWPQKLLCFQTEATGTRLFAQNNRLSFRQMTKPCREAWESS